MGEHAGREAGYARASIEPYYSVDGITIYHGKAEDVLPSIQRPVDLVFTSPPYNLGTAPGGNFGNGRGNMGGKWRTGALDGSGVTYDGHEDKMPPAEYVAWQKAILLACWDVLSYRGAIFYNHRPRVQATTLWTPLELNPGLPVRQIVVWARAGGINFAPTNYCPTHEWIVVFAKTAWRLKSKGASARTPLLLARSVRPQGANPAGLS